MNVYPVGCHRDASAKSEIVVQLPAGTIQAMDAESVPIFGIDKGDFWHRDVDRSCWTFTGNDGITRLFSTAPEAERFASEVRRQAAPARPAARDAATLPSRSTAELVEVIDGDTIRVRIAGQFFSVRYIGIDTPETRHPTLPVECFGPEAAAANVRLLANRRLELEKDVSETDQYGRLLRYVWAGGELINERLVREGFASVSTYPPDVRYQDRLLAAQREARAAGRGLWSVCGRGMP